MLAIILRQLIIPLSYKYTAARRRKGRNKNSTKALYRLYKAFVLLLQGSCTKSTRPMYKLYMGLVVICIDLFRRHIGLIS